MGKKVKKNFNIKRIGIFFICLLVATLYLITYFSTYSEFVSRIDNASVGNGLTGISNNTVILDDLKRDYYYYKGIITNSIFLGSSFKFFHSRCFHTI